MPTASSGAPEPGVAARALRMARLRKGFSTTDLALIAGQSHAYVSKIENGTIQPSLRGFSVLTAVLGLTPTEVWTIIMGEAAAAADECSVCGGKHELLLPVTGADGSGDTELLDCPVCRPWPQGFPGLRAGERASKRWIVPPYGPGRTPVTRTGGRQRRCA